MANERLKARIAQGVGLVSLGATIFLLHSCKEQAHDMRFRSGPIEWSDIYTVLLMVGAAAVVAVISGVAFIAGIEPEEVEHKDNVVPFRPKNSTDEE